MPLNRDTVGCSFTFAPKLGGLQYLGANACLENASNALQQIHIYGENPDLI
ncbi:hypothetical protein [Polynucleobacter bastaniensis]|jgi:hypothetical protein|uniref:hypothetical protein n=1 Tax=Polynucleobacter bastaniensis TaxID=2081039 RepID=UPI001C0CE95D|nr:hypothetical protein [Polynucleobacter bastaniensis]MBU3596752.1 hypothetical protein [Polynucleobacter bastaniensis]